MIRRRPSLAIAAALTAAMLAPSNVGSQVMPTLLPAAERTEVRQSPARRRKKAKAGTGAGGQKRRRRGLVARYNPGEAYNPTRRAKRAMMRAQGWSGKRFQKWRRTQLRAAKLAYAEALDRAGRKGAEVAP